jgi:NAD+ kinase
MKSIGIVATPAKPQVLELSRRIIELADQHGIKVLFQQECAIALEREDLACDLETEAAHCDVLISLGGDGTVLQAARMAVPHEKPVLSVDLGRLGFLAAVPPDEIDSAFEALISGKTFILERMLLEAEVVRKGKVISSGLLGLNDAVVAKSALARILRLSIMVHGDLVAQTRADGLIISTPTGSTAYALSAGGPIVHPDVPLFLLCPICPHSLTQRPFAVSSNEVIEVRTEWEGDEVAEGELEVMLTIDGQIGVPLRIGDVVRVQKSPHRAKLMRMKEESFYERLRTKMGWQ